MASNSGTRTARLLVPTETLGEYVAAGGGRGIERARSIGPDDCVELIAQSGLRGRGGAGFPTGTKWRSVRTGTGDRFVVCNAAEGEPATFKDRLLMRRNPYPVLEGIAIAANVVGARRAFVGLKESFTVEFETMARAADEMRTHGMLDGVDLAFVRGPDRYLLGEEVGLLGVIEGRGPFPREVRPFMQGLFATSATDNATLVNNVETLANVPWIVSNGPDWLRSVGTEGSPGTMLFTVAGDVATEGVFELPLGTTLGELVEGMARAKNVKAVIPGASSAVILPDRFDLALDFDVMRAAGTGLGAGGFAVYDETACMVEVLRQFVRFLHVESCAQCPACKLGSGTIFDRVDEIQAGRGDASALTEIVERAGNVTDGQKCALPTGTERLVLSMIESFAREFAHHVGRECALPREIVFPKLVDYDEDAGRFLYDRAYEHASPDWTQAPAGATEAET